MNYGIPKEKNQILSNLMNNDWSIILLFLVVIIGLFLFFLILRIIIKSQAIKNRHINTSIFLVRLPKERPGDKEKEFTVQSLREEIAKGETIFASIGGLRAERGLKSWLFGRSDNFSFEIVAYKKKIMFYVTVPSSSGRYIEQQIHAYYPDASVEEVSDYNIFSPTSKIVVGSLMTKRDHIFPLKTYEKQEVDPMNGIVNVMSKLNKDEGIAVQYVVRSSIASWHKKSTRIAREAQKERSLSLALSKNGTESFFNFVGEIAKSANPSLEKKDNFNNPIQQKTLTAMEEEALKLIEEKNSKAGLDVNIRVVVAAQDNIKAQLYLDNLGSAFSQYNYYEYGNNFNSKIIIGGKKVIQDFIYRRFDEKKSFLLNTEELTSLFHFPLKTAETPNIEWLSARHAPAPNDIPNEGILLGHNVFRGQKKDIRIKREDRRRHMYVVGKSGGGKSQFIAGMAIQDIINGEGVCVLDPHGDLVEDIVNRIPPERAEDVIVFSPADLERPLALNLIEFDERYPEQKSFVINEMISIFDKLYDLKSTGGPIFEQYMRNALLLIMSDPESGSTLMEIPKVLADAKFRNMKLEKCSDPTIVDFWRKEAEKAGGDAALANVVPYITSKLTQFISNDTMRPIIGQQKSSFQMRDIMDKQKILLIDLSKGAIGEMNAFLLGLILIGKILMASLSRTDISTENRKDFYLY
ncbi:DUF87 domain-containing protein, partial [Candidatus Parcubacteria bacterium]|nr:DUF87 domain-containing protein [Candidatus Parcubacteria bacterium]